MVKKTNRLICGNCKYNPEGICLKTNKEIGISYVMGRNEHLPKFCPLSRRANERKNRNGYAEKL
jgi:hypothetical protein